MNKRHTKIVSRISILLALPVMTLLSQPTGIASQPGARLEMAATAHQGAHVPKMTVSFMTAIQAGFR